MLYTAAMAFSGNAFAQTTSGALPVLINIDANLTTGNKVAISWTMLQKVNTDCFDVEKSNDGFSWRSIATVKALNDTIVPFTYNMVDAYPLKGANLYRIRIRDLSGQVGLTIARTIWVHTAGVISIYPNPSADRVNILLGQPARTNWTARLINSAGQLLLQKTYARSTTLSSLLLTGCPAGNYILEIADGHTIQRNTLMINQH